MYIVQRARDVRKFEMVYCVANDLYLTFGQTNIRKWADANNDEVDATIDARITWAIARATNHIDDQLRLSHYDVPFSAAPQSIVDLCAELAGCLLYQMPRGLADGEDAQTAINTMRDNVEERLKRIAAGQLHLDGINHTSQAYPAVVNIDDT